MWGTQKLSSQKSRDFFSSDGVHQHLKGALVMAVTFALRQIFIEEYEVPYIWVYKRDYISHFEDGQFRFELHFVDDQEFNPLAYAEQFKDSDPAKAQSPEELL